MPCLMPVEEMAPSTLESLLRQHLSMAEMFQRGREPKCAGGFRELAMKYADELVRRGLPLPPEGQRLRPITQADIERAAARNRSADPEVWDDPDR